MHLETKNKPKNLVTNYKFENLPNQVELQLNGNIIILDITDGESFFNTCQYASFSSSDEDEFISIPVYEKSTTLFEVGVVLPNLNILLQFEHVTNGHSEILNHDSTSVTENVRFVVSLIQFNDIPYFSKHVNAIYE